MRRIIRCLLQIWIPFNVHWSLPLSISPTLSEAHVGSSDPEAWIPSEKTDSLVHHLRLCPTWHFPSVGSSEPKGNFRLWQTGSLKDALTQNPTCIIWGRIIRLLWSVYLTLSVRIIRPYCVLQNSSNSAFLWVLSSCFASLGLFTPF